MAYLQAFVLCLVLACILCSSRPADVDLTSCTGPVVQAPDRICSAYYYRFDLGTPVTQALVTCRFLDGNVLGGNVVAFHGDTEWGIGLRWTADDALEVAVHPEAELVARETAAKYLGRKLSYSYRDLQPTDPEWQVCIPGHD